MAGALIARPFAFVGNDACARDVPDCFALRFSRESLGLTTPSDANLSQMGDAPAPELRFRPDMGGERLMLDRDEDSAMVIGAIAPHWLLSAINGTAALLLMFAI